MGDVPPPGPGNDGFMPGLPCRIILTGELGERFERGFAGLSPGRDNGRTELNGTLTSQAELLSMLGRLLDLDLQILSIRLGQETGREATEPPALGGVLASSDVADVVNRLFSVGLTLTGLQTLLGDGAAADQLDRAVRELDDAIRQVRSAALR